MCLACWDADKMEEKKNLGIDCDGIDMLTMSTKELKDTLTSEWLNHNKNSFRVYKNAINDIDSSSLTWRATNPNTKTQETITVRFV